MAEKYIRLWKLLLDKGMKKTDLKTEAGISSNVLAKLGKNEYVSMETMEKLCTSLDCNIETTNFTLIESGLNKPDFYI